MILLLPITFLLFFIFIKMKEETDFFETTARSLLLWQLALLIITNLLSIFHRLNSISLFMCWLLLSAILLVLIFRHVPAKAKYSFETEETPGAYIKSCIHRLWHSFSPAEKFMASLMLFLSGLLFVAALFTVPYNFDSMTYHLGRIAHWIDNQSVNHFITNIDRQNYSPVLAEYNLLHMYLLTGSDSFLNMLQYAAMLVTSLYIYKCARMLGTDRSFSIFGAFLFVTMPLTISQSVTTQNDLFGAMWFALFLYYLLRFIHMEHLVFQKETLKLLFFTALTVAFAFLTKTSICASMIFFLPWLLMVRLQKKDKLLSLLQSACFAGVSIAAVISETIIRNLLSAGTIMPDTASGNIMVATKNVSYIIVNILKNYSLILTQHLSDALNGFICRIAIHTGAALQVEVNNEAISFHGFDYIRHMNRGANMYSHDITPSAFVGYLAFFCGILLLILIIKSIIKSPKNTSVSTGFGISCWLSFGFIMALLRWQPWGTRLMYPALAMTIIMTANLLSYLARKITKKGVLLIPLASLSLFLAIPSIIYNTKPAWENLKEGCANRLSHYFTFNKRYESYQELSDTLLSLNRQADIPSDVHRVGVLISGDGYDYPLWLTFQQKMPEVRLEHILLEGSPSGSPAKELPSCILQIERGSLSKGDALTYQGRTYICIFVSSNGEDGIFQITGN